MAVAEPGSFFKQKRNASEIKAEILLPYFTFWVTNLLANQPEQLAKPFNYLDLQAGTGYDPDEKPAAPLLLLQQLSESTSSDLDLNQAVHPYFYDASEILMAKLQENLTNLPSLPHLVHQPVVLQNPEVQASLLEQIKLQPTLISLDPFSGNYAANVLAAASQGSSSDLFMVFSYSKMRQTVLAPEPIPEMNALFEERLDLIRQQDRTEKSAKKREQLLVQGWELVLKGLGFYVFTFKINLPAKDQTSYYLMLAAKSKTGYMAIKELLRPYSEMQEDGVALFMANRKEQPPMLPGFFRFITEYCLDNLVNELAGGKSQFHYKTITQIVSEHSIGKPYTKNNYLTALEKLREAGHIDLVDINNKKVKQITDTTVVFYKLHSPKKR